MELPEDWRSALRAELESQEFRALLHAIARARSEGPVFPDAADVFRAFALTPLAKVRVVLLGQDPYHGAGQAHGLCFSVPRGVKAPPSLRNIMRELHDDLAMPEVSHGDLSAWAMHGMLLLNTVLTVAEGAAGSHHGYGWERFTDAVIRVLNAQPRGLVFVLWGNPARAKAKLIDVARHRIVAAAHPSPLSAYRGFFGARPFSAIDAALASLGQPAFDFRRSE